MSWQTCEPYDYARSDYARRQHHRRLAAYVERHGLPCQGCGGMGGETHVILDDGTGPYETCGWCEGTGRVTRHLRGLYLRTMKAERKAAAKRERRVA